MKKFLFLLAALTASVACNKFQGPSAQLSPEADEFHVVTFTFPSYTIEPMTKAVVPIGDLITRLDVFLIDGADTTTVSQSKTDNPSDFGTVSFTLNKTKTYTLYAVAHKSNSAAVRQGTKVSFIDDRILDTFAYSNSFCPGDATSLSCVMSRIVGMFKVTFTDALPDDLAKVQFSVSGCGLAYDFASGASTNPGTRVATINNPSSANDGTTTFKIYSIAPNASDAANATIVVSALDANDDVIETKTFENVPIKAGYSAAYRGVFFVTTPVSGSFSGPDSWNDFEEEAF